MATNAACSNGQIARRNATRAASKEKKAKEAKAQIRRQYAINFGGAYGGRLAPIPIPIPHARVTPDKTPASHTTPLIRRARSSSMTGR
jgi:hypothetical protein